MKYKRNIIVFMITVFIIGIIYLSIHTYLNKQIINRFAVDFEASRLGGYTKTVDSYTLAVFKVPLYSTYTNLSVSNYEKGIDCIIWIPLYGENYTYGVILTDHEEEVRYQIELDRNFQPLDKQYQYLIDTNEDIVEEIKKVISDEWGIQFNV